MSTVSLAPRIARAGSVALRPSNYRPGLAIALLGLVALVALILALLGGSLLYRAALVCGAVMFVLLLLYVRALAHAARSGIVRVRKDAELRFVPAASVTLLPIAASLAGSAMGICAALALGQPEQDFGRGYRTIWGAVIIGALATVWLAQSLIALRRPAGLGLSSWGIDGVRGGPSVRLPWDLITEVTAIATPRGAELSIGLAEGQPLTVHGQYLGSDANVVAAVVEHFRLHPEDEALLASAVPAIHRVEAASS